MVLYECEACNFSSKIKSHYNRHLKTKKHLRNIEISLSVMVKTKRPKKTRKLQKKTQKDPKRPKKTQNSLAIFAKVPFPLMLTSAVTSYIDVKKTRSHSTKNCISNLRTKKKEFLAISKKKTENKKQIELLLSKVETQQISRTIYN